MGHKVKHLYNVDSMLKAANVAKTFDGAAGILLPRQLEHISTTIYEQKFAELSFLSQSGISINNEGGVAEFITKLKKNIQGGYKTTGNNSNTAGKIGVSRSSDTIPVIMRKAESEWTQIEMQQAQLANADLVADLLGAHNTRYNQDIDASGYVGIDNYKGLLNNAGFTTTASAGLFSALTGLQMYTELKDLINTQRAAVSNDPVFGADKVALSPGVYNLIDSTYIDTTGELITVRMAVERNLNVQFVITFRATSLGVAVAYSSDPRAMVMRIPTQLQISNIYEKGFDSYVESLYRVGGLDVIESASGYILTGVE